MANRDMDLEMSQKANQLLDLVIESSTTALSHVSFFGFTYMHMAPAPTIQQMAVLLRLLKANIEFILQEEEEVKLQISVKTDLENSLLQINLMSELADAIRKQSKHEFDQAVTALEQTLPV